MSNIKKAIIALSIILVIAVIVLVVILVLNQNNNGNNQQAAVSEEEGIDAYQKETDTTLNRVTNRIDYYTVKDCIGKYYSY